MDKAFLAALIICLGVVLFALHGLESKGFSKEKQAAHDFMSYCCIGGIIVCLLGLAAP
jgi:hypothetical protein